MKPYVYLLKLNMGNYFYIMSIALDVDNVLINIHKTLEKWFMKKQRYLYTTYPKIKYKLRKNMKF